MASFSKKYQKEEKSNDSDDFNFDDDDGTENSASQSQNSQVNVKPVSSLMAAEKNISNVKLDVDAIIKKLLSI